MNKNIFDNDLKLEILISTMYKTSLSFLDNMFPHHDLKKLNLLIINQTEKGDELNSNYKNIRIINSYEKGLSISRNIAIKNAIGDICLIADDDVEYLPNFECKIFEAFSKLQHFSIIQFKIKTFSGVAYKNYPKLSKRLTRNKDLISASSIEIAFKRKEIIEKNILFNPLFGLGSYFKSGEEYLFFKKALKTNLEVYFENLFIVKHKLERSTSNVASDNFVETKAALYYYNYKNLSYAFLFKFIFFLLRKQKISFKQFTIKYKVGVAGINKFKELKRLYE
ncbi:glycosyltransferase [Sabulilitoribacter arenilitoris]|uniref:Glycosyltransferase n=1 Tax=Wocania arenilitoris TaxID=2044858 RepID=A0AAE3EPX4_9FLAO|nr:glycosyltransferase [Wocania arenilitoris]MCF7569495.1 glycosyltransferase [Wocania arenilitoris]